MPQQAFGMRDADEEEEKSEEDSWSERFATALTTAYAAQQSAAAAKCSVSPGEVWRAALEAASNVGAKQVMPLCIPFLPLTLHGVVWLTPDSSGEGPFTPFFSISWKSSLAHLSWKLIM